MRQEWDENLVSDDVERQQQAERYIAASTVGQIMLSFNSAQIA